MDLKKEMDDAKKRLEVLRDQYHQTLGAISIIEHLMSQTVEEKKSDA